MLGVDSSTNQRARPSFFFFPPSLSWAMTMFKCCKCDWLSAMATKGKTSKSTVLCVVWWWVFLSWFRFLWDTAQFWLLLVCFCCVNKRARVCTCVCGGDVLVTEIAASAHQPPLSSSPDTSEGERWDEIRDLVCWEAVRLNRHTTLGAFVFMCVSPAVCLSLCVLPRLWSIMHIFALFIFLLIPQDTHPHVQTHAYMHIHKYTHTCTAHTMPEVVVTLSKQAFMFVFVLIQTKMVQQFPWSLFPAEKKGIWFIFPLLWCLWITALSLLCSSALKHFLSLNDFSLSKNLELVSKTHPKWLYYEYFF